MESIRLLRSKGIRFSLSITVSDSALDDQDSLLDSLADLGVADIGFNPILPSQHYQVSADYGERFADFLITAHMRLRELGFVEDRMRRKIEAFARAQVMFGDCAAAGGGQVVFSPEGRIGICHGMPADAEWFPGHVDDPDFEPASSPLFLEWSRYSPIFKDQCEGCGALGICGGGCPLRAYQSRGSWQAVDEQFCHHAKKTLDFLVWELFQTLDGQDSAGRSAAP
jgi:uncharacterized protein